MFCYYLLGVDTVALSGLYARLCHAFLVVVIVLLPEATNIAVALVVRSVVSDFVCVCLSFYLCSIDGKWYGLETLN